MWENYSSGICRETGEFIFLQPTGEKNEIILPSAVSEGTLLCSVKNESQESALFIPTFWE